MYLCLSWNEMLFLTDVSCFRDSLGRENVKEVKMSDRQHSQPAVVTVENLTTLRRYVIQLHD